MPMVARAGTFRGGVHPPDCKHLTRDRPIRVAALPSRVIIPLLQSAGEPPRCIAAEGQRVRTGEKIAEASGEISVPVHASISGTVTRIGDGPVPYGGVAPVIEIAGDGLDEKGWGGVEEDPLRQDRTELVRRIREAGLVGLGGAEFPTHVKLVPPADKRLDCIIINAAECEPFLTADYRLMVERPGEVVSATRLLMRAAGVERAIVGVEDDKRSALDLLARAARGIPGISVLPVKTKYPQGAEKQLISALLRREVPPGGLPADVGTVVQNVGTALAAWEAAASGKPLYERVVTVSGSAVREPGNLLVRLGTSFGEVIGQCGGLHPDASVLIMGGPMMGIAQWTTEVPVVKGTSGIIALTECRPAAAPEPCIRCGQCLRVCPMGLSPTLIRRAAEKGKWERAEEYGAMECMECGACAYVCATSKDQVQLYKKAKMEIRRRNLPHG